MSDTPAARGRLALAAYRVLWWVARTLTGAYWRLEIVGGERVPRSGAFVVAPVHRSNLDFLLAGLAVKRPVRYMAKSSIFLGGIVDKFLNTMGAFPVVRDTADFSAIRTCEALLAAGEPVVVFPEGRRKDGDTLVDLFDGPAFVAARQRVPILPVGIGGSDKAMPIGSKMIFPRKVVIVIGEPIYPDVDVDGRVPRSAITALTEHLREDVQSAYDTARRLAG
ncbi:MAG: lysophospholipid acyltransferase family protein [Acidimicrobiales bacterium]